MEYLAGCSISPGRNLRAKSIVQGVRSRLCYSE